jgi:hypothetical protein
MLPETRTITSFIKESQQEITLTVGQNEIVPGKSGTDGLRQITQLISPVVFDGRNRFRKRIGFLLGCTLHGSRADRKISEKGYAIVVSPGLYIGQMRFPKVLPLIIGRHGNSLVQNNLIE